MHGVAELLIDLHFIPSYTPNRSPHPCCRQTHAPSCPLYAPPPPNTDPPTPAVIRPTPLHALICPYVAPSVTGTCSEMCSSDDDCGDGQMCCSNGCGRACMTPDSVPYYSVPLECPSNRMADFVSRCDTTQPQCTDNSACAAADQLCCQIGGCGRYCTQGIQSTQPCFAVRDLFTSVGLGGLPGAFIPACQDDGSFSPSQFHGSTGLSWCADVRTGYPLSSFYPRGTMPQCSSESSRVSWSSRSNSGVCV